MPIKCVFDSTNKWLEKSQLDFIAPEECESTNLLAKNEAFDLKETVKVYTCKTQTKGRGRGDNSWESGRPGGQLFISWSFALASAPQPISAPLFGLATYEALVSTWPRVPFSLKAPNDIYIKDKKVGGILVESLSQGAQFKIVVGLGLNVLNHPKDITTATHITNYINDFITSEDWFRLLDGLNTQYSKTILLCQQSELELADQLLLKKALNRCPVYEQAISNVSPLGDIIFKDKTISWMDL